MESALSFTIGYHAFHPDRSINYQLNRFSDGTPASVAELSGAAPRITDYADYTRELRTLSDAAFADGRTLAGALYCVRFSDPRPKEACRRSKGSGTFSVIRMLKGILIPSGS